MYQFCIIRLIYQRMPAFKSKLVNLINLKSESHLKFLL